MKLLVYCFTAVSAFMITTKAYPERPPPVAGISRPNYGVDFNFLYPINNMHGSWKHAWTVDLSILDRGQFPFQHVDCPNKLDFVCQAVNRFLTSFTNASWTSTKGFQQTFNWMHNPQVLQTINRGGPKDLNRKKRALLPFVGDIEKFFFGVATESDIASMQQTIDDLTKLHDSTIHQITNLGDNLASLTKTTNEQLANTEEGFRLVKRSLQNLTEEVNGHFREMEKFMEKNKITIDYNTKGLIDTWDILAVAFPRVFSVMSVAFADLQLLSSIQSILQGFVPMSLIPPEELKNGLEIALEGIRAIFPQAQLSYPLTALGYYYTHKVATPIMTADKITLIVDIPVDLDQQILYAYAIRTFPVPLIPYNPYTHMVDPQSKAAKAMSRFVPEADVFLITPDGQYWSTSSTLELSLCKGETVKFCPSQFSLYGMDQDQCLPGIWKNQPFDIILSLCTYEITHVLRASQAASFTQVVPLSGGRWYISGPLDSEWTITCPSRPPETRKPCTSCVITVDCGCGVIAKTFRIPTRLSACQSVFSPLNRNFTVNPFSYLPKNHPWIVNLTGDMPINHPPAWKPDIILPDSGNWDDVMESMDQKSFNLNRLYAKSINETKLYRTEAEALLQKIKNQDKFLAAISNYPSWLLGLAVALTFANSAVLILLCCCLANRAFAAPTWMDEVAFIETMEEGVMTLEVIILIVSTFTCVMVCILAWPILTGWCRQSKIFKRWNAHEIRIKAVNFRHPRGYETIELYGTAVFSGQHVRKFQCRCKLGSVPMGTFLEDNHQAVVVAESSATNNQYKVTLCQPITAIFPDDRTKIMREFTLDADYVNRKFSVPSTCRLESFNDIRIYISKQRG